MRPWFLPMPFRCSVISDWYFVRHGETDYNKQTLMQGHSNIPLNEKGRQQAKDAAAQLRTLGLSFDVVYSSPLDRAMETARILSGKDQSELRIDQRIIELGFGVLEGTSFRVDPAPEVYTLNHDPAHYIPPKGGESLDALYERTHAFLEDLRLHGPEGSLLIVSHGAAIRGMMMSLTDMTVEQFWDFRVGNCDILHFHNENGVVTECAPVLRHEDPFDPHLNAK